MVGCRCIPRLWRRIERLKHLCPAAKQQLIDNRYNSIALNADHRPFSRRHSTLIAEISCTRLAGQPKYPSGYSE
jgi:hypothetical protein